jgi:hypothetical protein
MATLITREGGEPFVAPSVQERPLDDSGEALRFVERLASGEFDMLVCMTGAGLVFWRDQVAVEGAVDRLRAALRAVAIVSRGPEPLPILRDWELTRISLCQSRTPGRKLWPKLANGVGGKRRNS